MYFKHILYLGSSWRNLSMVKNSHYHNIKIGNVSKNIFKPKNPHLVPVGYVTKNPSQNLLQHLLWVMKKDILGQDMFLIGLPGPYRSRVILQYLELTRREFEYVVLSRDTTENDLKQRREILNGTAHYIDQSAVRAAIEGRFLILDGIEKVERNVLPVLNNLLENREMQLEDGRFLIASDRYDKLMQEHSKETLDQLNLVRVSENFRVVALGLPVPSFKGNPLDPPFRSRFQARNIQLSFEENLSELSGLIPNETLKNFISACYAFQSEESESLGLPKFPVENIPTAVKILSKMPDLPLEHAFRWMYPYNLALPKDGQKSVFGTLEAFSIAPKDVKSTYEILYSNSTDDGSFTHLIEFKGMGRKNACKVWGHKIGDISEPAFDRFIPNRYHNNVLTDMLRTHTQHDFCIVGNKGSGKSFIARKFASLLNYPTEMVMLYADMTARDLLQQRVTDENGNTVWRHSQIVKAAKEGKLLVLDGLHRLHPSTLSVLQRLIHCREMQLYDGTRFLSHDSYKSIRKINKLTDAEMRERNIESIHPAFRIVALAETPKLQTTKEQWLTPELMSMFLFHSLRPLSLEEEKYVIKQLVGKEDKNIDLIIGFAHKLRNSEDEALKSVSVSFSTRQLVRLASRLSTFADINLHNLISQACLLKFLPQLTKQAVENVIESCDIKSSITLDKALKVHVNGDKLFIGNTSVSVYDPKERKVKVPDIVFYDNQEHLKIMEAMLQDFILGEHLLLVGNQGVGKNKITDRFLQLLNRPREYIQLHRDTTVQSLTQQPTVLDGKIVYEDSPLLKAVLHGNVLIVDEADKAPTHVTSILKALVESGEMVLSDGRCIVHHSETTAKNDPSKIVMHPDFRMIVLANRPGFPFLGNDFFATLGDIFSCHAVDNPSLESEIAMLRQYAPNVPEAVLKKLTGLFGELRSMSDAGLISYPYSIREIVNVTKHIGIFPDERISYVLKNVFDFDLYSSDLRDTLHNLFRKFGIPFEGETITVKTATYYKLPELSLKTKLSFSTDSDFWVTKNSNILIKSEHIWNVKKQKLDITETRGSIFSEEVNYFRIPIKSNDIPLSVDKNTSSGQNILHVATGNPISLYSINQDKGELESINLSSYFPTIRTGFKPSVRLSTLGSKDAVYFHETSTNTSLYIQPSKGLVKNVNFTPYLEDTMSRITSVVYSRAQSKQVYSYVPFPFTDKILMFMKDSDKLCLVDFSSNKAFNINAPINIKNVFALGESACILISDEDSFVADLSNPAEWKVRKFQQLELFDSEYLKLDESTHKLENLTALERTSIKTLMANSEDYATIISGSLITDQQLDVFSFPRVYPMSEVAERSCILPESAVLVRFLYRKDLPNNIKNKFEDRYLGFLELVGLKDSMYGYIGVELPHISSSFASWLAGTSESYLYLCKSRNGEVLTVDLSGYVRRWQVSKEHLDSSFVEWSNSIGLKQDEQLSIEYSNPNAAEEPKHGKVDPSGNPHVGGNTWAGGTGGRDTAGLGGKGGPYRLDAGHTVYQLSDAEKEAVPQEVRDAARKMALKAYEERLNEIEMSEYDAELYGKFLSSVKKQINILRVILDGLQAKGKERQWTKHQTSGEFDDTKLIESITGEKSIYKKRDEVPPEAGSTQEKPKLLRLVVDVSGSMYRFNGHDERLQRELESIVLVMEAFDGYQDKFKYEVVGHSGEEHCLEFSSFNKLPKNEKEKLDIVRKMYSHSQFCISGDNTLPATQHAISTITNEEADEYFVIVLSDANFDRYGISPASFNNILVSNPKVNAFAIFIGSLGNQAAVLSKQMAAGRTFVCFDSANLTTILQKIFTSALLKDS